MKNKIQVLNGPNLNLLGTREPQIYGSHSLASIEKLCQASCTQLGLELEFKQSNHEGQLVDWLQQSSNEPQLLGIVINAAAYTHTSIAIADAIKSLNVNVIEVHLSNTHCRESFRQHSYLTPVVTGCILGLGIYSYSLAIQALYDLSS